VNNLDNSKIIEVRRGKTTLFHHLYGGDFSVEFYQSCRVIGTTLEEIMSKVAKPLQESEFVNEDGNEIEFIEDDSSVDETKKAAAGFTPTQPVSWPFGSAQPPQEPESALDAAERVPGEAAKVNRTLENQEEAEKARQDDHQRIQCQRACTA
jgi:hypothetical protein